MMVSDPSVKTLDDSERLSLLSLLNAVLRYRRTILLLSLGGMVAALALGLIQPRIYTSSSSFVPQTQRGRPELEGMAAQFGINLAQANDVTQTPAFYVDLIHSEHIMRAAALSDYADPRRPSARANLVEIYDVDAPTAEERLDEAITLLRANSNATPAQRTNMVTLKVRARSPQLATAINQRVLDLLNEFNATTRKSQAAEKRKFAQARLQEVAATLRAAEDRYGQFLTRNRRWESAPELQLQHDRLAREIGMQQTVYTTLAQSLEQAKIDEVRDIPVFTIIDTPSRPVRPDDRRIALKGIVGLLLGLGLGVLIAFIRGTMLDARLTNSSQFAELQGLTAELTRSLPARLRRAK